MQKMKNESHIQIIAADEMLTTKKGDLHVVSREFL